MRSERGDTLVEVLLAIVILSAVIVGALRIMSTGQSLALSGVERTQVQSLLASQLDMVRYARDEYARSSASPGGQVWSALRAAPYGTDTSAISADICGPAPRNGFWLESRTTSATQMTTIFHTYPVKKSPSTLPTPGDGIWLEAQHNTSSGAEYLTVVAKACWSAVGEGPEQTSQSTVRLYVP